MYGVRRRQRSERYDTALLLPPTMLIMMLLFVGCRNKVDAWNVASPTLFHRQRLGVTGLHNRFTGRISSSSSSSSSTICLWASPSDTAGADIESQATLPLEPPAGANDEGDDIPVGIKSNVEAQSSSSSPLALRGKVNEIDYCIAPADVSLSRAYRSAGVNLNNVGSSSTNSNTDPNTVDDASLVGLSLTRALNNASNRAVRRILLSRSWPSAEALNQSLRKAVAAMDGGTSPSQSQSAPQSSSKTARTDAEYIADQLQSFAAAYGSLPGYAAAQTYLECVLSLATSGIEPPELVSAIRKNGIYDEAYQRILSVLQSGGVEFVASNASMVNGQGHGMAPQKSARQIAPKLKDQDICWSMLDKLQLRQEASAAAAAATATAAASTATTATTKTEPGEDDATPNGENKTTPSNENTNKNPFLFWQRNKPNKSSTSTASSSTSTTSAETSTLPGVLVSSKEPTLTRQLNALSNIVQRMLLFGGDQEILVLAETLNADVPAFTQRWYPESTAVAPPTSDASSTDTKPRPGLDYLQCLVTLLRQCRQYGSVTDLNPPQKLPASYANAYERLVATAVERGSGYLKPQPLFGSSSTSTATTGMETSAADAASESSSSGSSVTSAPTTATSASVGSILSSMPKPRTAQEELGRFAVWESNFRQSSSSSAEKTTPYYSPYPTDLVGSWQVRDEIVGETIGTSTVTFLERGNVQVAAPLQGLSWRLDPGPTHLDTCTFQVLSTLDGTILQYRGFIDRGARLEARFSKRSIQIRGSVMFQNLRDGASASVDYYKDMLLPINYRTGTTNFVMTKTSESGGR